MLAFKLQIEGIDFTMSRTFNEPFRNTTAPIKTSEPTTLSSPVIDSITPMLKIVICQSVQLCDSLSRNGSKMIENCKDNFFIICRFFSNTKILFFLHNISFLFNNLRTWYLLCEQELERTYAYIFIYSCVQPYVRTVFIRSVKLNPFF